ncbi:hypothetical protein [Pseudomonas savastanoi]|uniref:hypothetical protein n=1 Tax=Pseudomonas savastanoi TaxID=29438 RepID=UPI000EFE55C1|nr:hypothetical protein [Pseudomonas savastanoi]
MSNDKMREEFEAWANGRYGWEIHDQYRDESERTLSTWNGERYDNRIVEGMWQAWQASREALVIELPEERAARGYGEQVADALGFNDGISYCRDAIEAAGVKVKS